MAAKSGILTIANGATDSQVIAPLGLGVHAALLIIGPAVLAETVNIKVSRTATGNFSVLQTNALDIALPAGKATQVVIFGGCYWKLTATGAAGAQRQFDYVLNRLPGFTGA